MKLAIPLVLCSFALTGCITVNTPENNEDPSESPSTDQPGTQNPDQSEQPSDDGSDSGSGNDDVGDGGTGGTPDNGGDSSGNTAPVISGDPTNDILVNQYYSFKPSASDADGDNLSFIVANLPDWATFDSTTGEIDGTPSQNNSYKSIVISVTDGTHTTSLNAFDINVTLPDPVQVTLTWQIPSEDVNGDPIDNVDAFKIYYGVNQGNHDYSITVTDGQATSHTINNLSPGNYYFAMVAITDTGMESALSNEMFLQVGQ